jgi:thiol-disulfide isomerase/thioredoxin
MNKIFLVLTFALLLPLSSCAQKKSNTAEPKLPEGVYKMALPTVVEDNKILENIKTNFSGKVAVIDFWATWCGPCMQAMKKIDPIKEQYKKNKKNVVFVYVTGETSPKATWDNAIKNIKGYHYRLTDDQFNTLLKSLGIKGIPTYLIINTDGSVAYNNISTGGYPGDEIIQAEIDKALAK